MKKLITTAIVAAAAFGAFAIETGVRFEGLEAGATSVSALNEATGDYWDEPEGAENTYTVVAMDAYTDTRPAAFTNETSSQKALSVKTTFGQPLSFSVNADVEGAAVAQDIGSGLYFDGLTKFTVCEEAPEVDSYTGAKIVMWLQEQYDEDDNVTGTNLMVRAGFLSYENDVIAVSNAVYTCDQITAPGFADAWHRVTIKMIADITEGAGVPGFAIYIDGEIKSTGDIAKWDASFDDKYAISEIADNLDGQHAIFPSLIQAGGDKTKIYSASFDGTGSINELQFTATAPTFASDEQYMDPKFDITIGNNTETFRTVAKAVDYVNQLEGEGEYTLRLANDITISAPLAFNNNDESITIVLDLCGKEIINENADESWAITVAEGTALKIIDSSIEKTGKIVSTTENEASGAINLGQDAVFTLAGGTIDGYINVDNAAEYFFVGGAVDKSVADELQGTIGEYKFSHNEQTSFYDVVPLTYYDVTFKVDDTDYFATNVVEGTLVADIVPADPTKTGYNFTGWDPEATTITSNTTFTAQWEAVAPTTYTITFVIGDTTNTIDKAYGSTITAEDFTVPAKTGYTGAWDDDPVDDVVEGAKTYTYTYTAITYTITYELNGGTQGDNPVSSYTVNSGTVTLPEPTYTGYTFNGWTNETVTTAIKEFTVDASKLGDLKFYAAWTANPPATYEIPAGDTSVEVAGASDANAEDIAGQVTLQVTPEVKEALGTVSEETYQGYFKKTAEYDETASKWTVTAEIKETVKADVAQSAVDVLNGVQSAAVEVPHGLFYKVTTMTQLGGSETPVKSGLSDGTPISVTKPSSTSGFIKILLGTKSFE